MYVFSGNGHRYIKVIEGIYTMDEEYTTMRLRVSTRDRLAKHGNAGSSLEDALITILNKVEGEKTNGKENKRIKQ